MPRRTLYKNTFYHVYNRGWEKRRIFLTERDIERFVYKLGFYRERFPTVKVVAFAVLQNHFHLLVMEGDLNMDPGVITTPGSAEVLSKFLGQLQNSYAKYFNKKYDHRGQLFEGRFCAKLVETERYFIQVKTYIEWNAVKHGIVKNPQEWPYSTYDSETTPEGVFDESFGPGFD